MLLPALGGCCRLFSGPWIVTSDRESYRPGDRIILVLDNRSNREFGSGHLTCDTHIERWEDGVWVRKWEEQDRMLCEDVLKVQAACSRRVDGFSLPPGLPPGKYRLAHYKSDALLWESNTFRITSAAASSPGKVQQSTE